MSGRRRGPFGMIMGAITILFFLGVFLAVLSQFNGDLGEMFSWLLDLAWSFVSAVRDTLANWDTFQRLF